MKKSELRYKGYDLLTKQILTVQFSSRKGVGSGLILTSDGIVASCAHVVSNSPKASISWLTEDFSYRVLASKLDKKSDIAIVKADFTHLPTKSKDAICKAVKEAKVRRSMIYDGEPVIVCGYPALAVGASNLPLFTSGIVSFIGDDEIIVSAMINHGNSGGPCFDQSGRIIGLVKEIFILGKARKLGNRASLDIPNGYGAIVPFSAIAKLMERFLSQKS